MTFNYDTFISDTAVSVAGLTEYIQVLLEENEILRQIWVVGEVSSANNHRVGLFFTLQDPDGGASIKCVTWKTQVAKLAQIPSPGEQVIILGSIKLYPARGEYQLQVWQVLPAGEGLQAIRYKQLKNRLAAEGLFDEERKRDIPPHPKTIAVVSSPTAAAWGDIQKTLRSRYPGLHVLFSPAIVQGDEAPTSIVNAIKRVEKDGRAEVLILARGGGAVEELACFDDEQVVIAVANCTIPVITGIGHQRDESLADLAADLRVHTPTAAAERVVPSLDDLYNQHLKRIDELFEMVRYIYESAGNKLQKMRDRLTRLSLDKQVQQRIEALSWRRQRLLQNTSQKLISAKQHLEMSRQKLETLDPKKVLQRGYAVVRKENGEIARAANELKVEDELFVLLGEGEIKVKVVQVKD
ncbi:MAG: exodeoxyribonuclease VII large subunit [Calothrix sp. C42_A2020_038]|nr:exodeoxyribonuclease VII large subunit [Calothrix sp. C42_A2020_038]